MPCLCVLPLRSPPAIAVATPLPQSTARRYSRESHDSSARRIHADASGYAGEKYTQAAQRPKEAWYVESEGGKVTMAFSMTTNPMKESQLPQFAEMMKKAT